MDTPAPTLRDAIRSWLGAEPAIRSAVLFGSSAASRADARQDRWSDYDLHLTTTNAGALVKSDWAALFPGQGYCFQAVKPATGGVRKLTVVFKAGQMDLIIVPLHQLRLARLGLALGLQHGHRRLREALNEISTCLRGGYVFLKGEREWGRFYGQVAGRFPGVRLDDREITELADIAVVDLLWVRQKLKRGELAAAQHVLHRSLAETNFKLLRELRLRRGDPLPSFGLGRHVESLLAPGELAWVRIDAACEARALLRAAETAQAGLVALMGKLVPAWEWPKAASELFAGEI